MFRITKHHVTGNLAGLDTTHVTDVQFQTGVLIDGFGSGSYIVTVSETVCRHGHTGFCWDDATSEQRDTFEALHRHAYSWAYDIADLDGDVAECYAADYAAAHFMGDIAEAPAHPTFYRQWESLTNA